MNFATTRQATSRSRPAFSRIREPQRRWEEETEKAWRNAPDHGPGFWKMGLWLSHDFLSVFFRGKSWSMTRPWADEE